MIYPTFTTTDGMSYSITHGSISENKEKLGRFLGILPNEGNEIAQAIQNANARVITRRIIRGLTVSELHSESQKAKRCIFDEAIKKKLGDDSISSAVKPDKIPYSDDDELDLADLPED